MKLIFNDATSMAVQNLVERSGCLKIKIINHSRDEILQIFTDNVKVKKMIIQEQRTSTVYEGYAKFESLTEYTGGLYEVCLIQDGKSIDEIMNEVSTQITEIQMALCEVFESIGV